MTEDVPTPAPGTIPPLAAPKGGFLHGNPLAPSRLAEWLTQLSMWAEDGVSIEDAMTRMQQSGLTLVQAGLVIQTYMRMPDSPQT